MMKDAGFDLAKVSSQVLNILKELGLNPIAFGVTITLERSEFERLADKHSDHVLPPLILKTHSESDGVQWSIQILREITSENLPND